MPDLYLAQRLRDCALASYNLSSSAVSYNRDQETACLGAGLLAQATHLAFVGFVACRENIEDDINAPPHALTHLARQLAEAGLRQFQPFEIEILAYLDTVHTQPISRVLLPDEVAKSIYSHSQALVGRLVHELTDHLQAQKAGKS